MFLSLLTNRITFVHMDDSQGPTRSAFPRHGFIGLLLVAIFWPLNWFLPGNPTAYLFFPLWLGYVLVVDGLVYKRTGSSLLARSRRDFVLLFFLSAPAWWLFEWINKRTQNWEYLARHDFGALEYFLLSSLSFSTVMPAVFETAELVLSFSWTRSFRAKAPLRTSGISTLFLFGLGLAMAASVLLWPRYCYPFVWTSLVLILEPINVWLRHPNLLERLNQGDWRQAISLALGALICGFFWEMWNYWSVPQVGLPHAGCAVRAHL